MKDPTNMEVPEAFRAMAEQNLGQARQAYDQFMDIARQAQEAMRTQTGDVASAARDMQTTALGFAQQNMEAGFEFLGDLSKAKDLQEFLEIQTKHTEKSVKSYTEQAQQLGQLISEMTPKK